MTDYTFTEEMQNKFESLIMDEMARTKTPGMSIAIVKDDKITYNGNFGASNLEKREPTNENTLYRIASVTKSFISVGILILEAQGKLSLQDPISKFLPLTLGDRENPMNIEHLMVHTSGIPEIIGSIHEFHYHENRERVIDFPHFPMTSWDDFFRYMNGASEYIQDSPGIHQHYQNDGYAMLGRIIEVVSDKSLNEFMVKNIFKPLEMRRSTFLFEIFDKLDNVAIAYSYSESKKKIVKSSYEQINEIFGYAPGGLMSSVKEMANYLIFHINQGKFKDKQILPPDKLEAMYQFHFEETPFNRLFGGSVGTFGKTGYGYGFALYDDFYGYKLIHHSGSWLGSSAWFAFIPELKIGVVSLANKHPSPRMYALIAMAMMLGIDVEKEFPLFAYRSHVKKLTGYYEGYNKSSTYKIFAKEGLLYLKMEQWGIDTPLLPYIDKSESPITLNYYVLTDSGAKTPVIFREEKDNIWLDLERLKAKKTRDL